MPLSPVTDAGSVSVKRSKVERALPEDYRSSRHKTVLPDSISYLDSEDRNCLAVLLDSEQQVAVFITSFAGRGLFFP